MKRLLPISIIISLLLACGNNESASENKTQQDSSSMPKANAPKSIPSETKKFVGNTDIKINYTAPAVRGRKIWGGLVPYDEVWATGAHMATTLEIGKDFKIGDKHVPAGKYALFTIPGREEWTVVINKNWDQHLADEYAEKDDVVRVKVKPRTTEEVTERLNYAIDQTGERTANIIISWEKLQIPFSVEIK